MPIRVCFLIDRLSRAGTESQLIALIRVLDRRKIEPSLLLLDGTDAESRSLEPADCAVHRLGVKRLLSRGAVQAAWRVRELWKSQRPDILQVYFLDSAYFGLPLAKLLGVPHLLRVRNNLGYWLTPKHRFLNRLVGHLADVTLTNSEAGRQALQQSEYLPHNRVRVLTNGVDLEPFLDAPEPFPNQRPPIVGCVANLRPVKNIDGLIRAAAIVHRRWPEVRFLIAGEGDERPRLEQLRTELRLQRVVELVGSVTDVPAFLAGVDLAVLPSHSEGMSNAVLEYMAAGRAIVATDVGANAALLAECGVIIAPGQDQALAHAIGTYVRSPELARQHARNARTRVEAEFSRQAMARRFEAFYAELLADA